MNYSPNKDKTTSLSFLIILISKYETGRILYFSVKLNEKKRRVIVLSLPGK